MTKVIAIFNVDTNSNFKQQLKNQQKLQDQKQDASFAMFIEHALQERKVEK